MNGDIQSKDPIVAELFATRGTKARVAAACRISKQAVGQWSRIPADRVLIVEQITGVNRKRLRPDIYT